MGSDDWPEWLPGDWTVHIKKIDGRKVKCYIDPDGHKCYSKPQVFDYLKMTNKSIPVEKTQNAEDLGIDLSVVPDAPQTDVAFQSPPGEHLTKLTPRTNGRKSITGDLSEAFTAGNGSSSGPSSSKKHSGDFSWLPAGWTVEDKYRKGGRSTGMKYKMYVDPSGHKFFSKPQVLNYLAKTNSNAAGEEAIFVEPISATPISAWQENPTTEADSSQIYEATEAEKIAKETTQSPRLPSDYEVTSRTPADGLPPGWIKEIRTRKSGVTRRNDPYYLHPSSEYVFFSKKDVLRYLESGNIMDCASRPLKRNMNNDDTLHVDFTMNGGESTPLNQCKGTEGTNELTNGPAEELRTNESGIDNPKPVRSITGGAYQGASLSASKKSLSASKASLSASKEDNPDWLPDGWVVEVRHKLSGQKFKIYRDTASGKQLYSKPQVMSYLGIADSSGSIKRKEHKSSGVPVTSPKRSGKKRDKSEDYQEVITTSAAEGLPEGWIKEIRTKIYATHKRNDPFYTDPETGYIFRSKLDALRYLESGDFNLCAIRPKVKNEDGQEVFVTTDDVKKPTTGDDVSTENPGDHHTPDNTNRRVSSRATKNSSPLVNTPSRASKRQKGKTPEASGGGEGDGEGQEKQGTGVNLEKQPDDDGNLSFDIPEDDNWTDHCIDFAVKTLTNEIIFNGEPVSGGFQDENGGVGTTAVKETSPTKVN